MWADTVHEFHELSHSGRSRMAWGHFCRSYRFYLSRYHWHRSGFRWISNCYFLMTISLICFQISFWAWLSACAGASQRTSWPRCRLTSSNFHPCGGRRVTKIWFAGRRRFCHWRITLKGTGIRGRIKIPHSGRLEVTWGRFCRSYRCDHR